MADIEQRAAQDNNISKENQQIYHDEIRQAQSDASELITTPYDRSQFDLELQGKSDISKLRVDSDFQRKNLKELKVGIEEKIDNSKDNFIKASNPKEKASAILERNTIIQNSVRAGLLEPAEAKERIYELDKKWAMSQVDYDITTNPEMAEEGLSKKAYPNIDEADRVDLLSKARMAIKQNKQEADDQIEEAQISNESQFLAKFASGEAGWMDLSDVASQVRQGTLPEKFGSAYADVIKAQGEYTPSQDENENYPEFINYIYQAKDKKELQTALYGLLKDHKNISQEKMSVLINAALKRGNALSLRPVQLDPKRQEEDAAARQVVNMGKRQGMTNNEISDIYQNFNKDITAGKTPDEALNNATKTHAIYKNPALLRIPPEGKIMSDKYGNIVHVMPDLSIKDLKTPTQPQAKSQEKK